MSIFNNIKQDRILFFSLSGSLFLVVLTCVIIIFLYKNIPPFIPLFNQLPLSDARLGTKVQIFFPPLLALGLCIANAIICENLYGKTPLLARIVAITSLLTAFFVSFFIVRILQLIL